MVCICISSDEITALSESAPRHNSISSVPAKYLSMCFAAFQRAIPGRVIVGQDTSSFSNIRPCHSGQVHDGANNTDIWYILHLVSFLVCLWALILRQFQTRVHRSINSMTLVHSKALQDIHHILLLRQIDLSVSSVPPYSNTQQV